MGEEGGGGANCLNTRRLGKGGFGSFGQHRFSLERMRVSVTERCTDCTQGYVRKEGGK